MAHNQAIEAILAERPNEWDDRNYINERYHLINLVEGSDEFRRQTASLRALGLNVARLQRIQNPFQYGRFIIRKLQLESRGRVIQTEKYYHPLSRVDLVAALEYNMDSRRYQSLLPGQDRRIPIFYRSPPMEHCHGEKILLICNVLGEGHFPGPETTNKSNDSEYMPVYVVFLQ